MALTSAQIEQQKKQAEELLFEGPQTLGFVKALFFGHFNPALVFPYPALPPAQQAEADQAVEAVRAFCDEKIDPVAIDRDADIPQSVIDGLGELGVLGMTLPKEVGGRNFTQQQYCQVLEVIGAHDSSVAVFVNAHHSIGVRAFVLFGTEEQRRQWLPDLVAGKKLAAFALTEEQAGSDAANVQTRAEPTPDGKAFVLNGHKRYITNGGIAQVLTVMARTPAPTPDRPDASKVTAFLVTPDMPGFEVVEARQPKCGIRGTATGRLKFTNMRVPRENVFGPIGKGLKVALTVLDFGRTTFGATCSGVAKKCIKAASQHAKSRVQFEQTLSEFELVKKKIAFMAAHAFAMEATTQHCASLIDKGYEDFMLETAILKVFATEHLWTIVNDTIQIFGGKAYFTDEPYERMMRDARINTIGEGANDVLKAFVAVVGCRGPGLELDALRRGMKSRPFRTLPKLFGLAGKKFGQWISSPKVPVQNSEQRYDAAVLGKRVQKLGLALPWVFLEAGTEQRFVQSQLQHERIADVAIDLYTSACTLSRLDHLVTLRNRTNGHGNADLDAEIATGRYYLKLADERLRRNLAALCDHKVDPHTVATANAVLGRY
jgi:alkylation response protein AidB-like acyl-CoA dehydrogenase